MSWGRDFDDDDGYAYGYDYDDYVSKRNDDSDSYNFLVGRGGKTDNQDGYQERINEDGSRSFQYQSRGRELLAELASQRKTGEFVDAVVEVEGRQFPCHRAVLATMSYFKAMLSSNFADSKSKVVHLHGIDSFSFSKILDFLYTGNITIGKDDVQNILQTAHMLQFDRILKHCRGFIWENICPSNCLGVMRLADMYDISDLKAHAKDSAWCHFTEVVQNEEFLTLSVQELLDLLTSCEYMYGMSEDDVVSSVLTWLDHDPENRKTVISTILQEIQFECVKVSMLKKLEEHAVIRESAAECLARITSAKEKHLGLPGPSTPQLTTGAEIREKAESKPRRPISDDLAILLGGWKLPRYTYGMPYRSAHYINSQVQPLQSIICLNPDSRQYYHVANLPTPVSGNMSVASAGGHLYVTGGRVSPTVGEGPHPPPSRQAFRYDFPTDTWMALPDMPRGRAGHQSAVADGKLFLVGGDTEVDAAATPGLSMDCYDLDKGAWIKNPVLPAMDTSSALKVTAFGDEVVLIETVDHRFTQSSTVQHRPNTGKLCVHVFDVKTERWAYSDISLDQSLYNRKIFTTAVDGGLHICIHNTRAFGYGGIVGLCGFDIYVYDLKEKTISKAENGNVVTGSFLSTQPNEVRYQADGNRQEDIAILNHKYKGSKMTILEIALPGPFVLFGHSFLDTKKSGAGWYCRELVKLVKEAVIF